MEIYFHSLLAYLVQQAVQDGVGKIEETNAVVCNFHKIRKISYRVSGLWNTEFYSIEIAFSSKSYAIFLFFKLVHPQNDYERVHV